FIQWSIDADKTNPTSRAHRLLWSIDSDKVALEKRFDGCYIISTDVDKDQMNTSDLAPIGWTPIRKTT
ncbi:MAG: hypothetical protein LJE70_05910, partial [Chromatiaceae bacterium]|nr:hypothetical protein [Chromatiaceae bacterium]